VARRTGFSASFLSQVELGQCSPSISSLQKICEALGTDLPDLLAPRGTKSPPVTRRSDRETFRSAWSKATAQSLASGRNLPYSSLLVSIRPGGKTGQLHAPGGHFFAFCIKGRVRVALRDVPHELAAGDSIAVDQPRAAWENWGRTTAEILVVAFR
jgi:transcriptional regulator with XRE-family HTH domain